MQTDFRTAPHQVKPCLPKAPGLLPCLKADFMSEFSPWPFLCSKVGFCRLWLSRNTRQVWGAGARHWLTNTCVTVSLLRCVNDGIAQHDRISPKSFFIYWCSLSEIQGRAVHYWLEKEEEGQRVLPWLLGEILLCAPSSAATLVGDTNSCGPAGPSWFLSPTMSVSFTTAEAYLCSSA